jgi:hypothetical protein
MNMSGKDMVCVLMQACLVVFFLSTAVSMFWLPIFFLMGLVPSNNSGFKVQLLNIYCQVFVRIIILDFKIINASEVIFFSVFCRHY